MSACGMGTGDWLSGGVRGDRTPPARIAGTHNGPVPATCSIHHDEQPDERQQLYDYVDRAGELHERKMQVVGTGDGVVVVVRIGVRTM